MDKAWFFEIRVGSAKKPEAGDQGLWAVVGLPV